jgi:hypothetical protein
LKIFDNKILGRIYGARRDKVTTIGRNIFQNVLHNLYSSSNIIRVIKSRRVRWAWHERISVKNPKGTDLPQTEG